MTTCSTHVLDSVLGTPAAGVGVQLTDSAGGVLADAVTDPDGRVRFAGDLPGGVHRLRFATGEWFAAAGRVTFHPEITVAFTVDPAQPHHHVALLLGPFAYTTYRGS